MRSLDEIIPISPRVTSPLNVEKPKENQQEKLSKLEKESTNPLIWVSIYSKKKKKKKESRDLNRYPYWFLTGHTQWPEGWGPLPYRKVCFPLV